MSNLSALLCFYVLIIMLSSARGLMLRESPDLIARNDFIPGYPADATPDSENNQDTNVRSVLTVLLAHS